MWQRREVLLELSRPLYNSHIVSLLTLSPLWGIPGRREGERASPRLRWPCHSRLWDGPLQLALGLIARLFNCQSAITFFFSPPKDDKSRQELTIFIHPTDLERTCASWAICNSTSHKELDWSISKTSGGQWLFPAPQCQGGTLLCLGFAFCFSAPRRLCGVCGEARPTLPSFICNTASKR